MAIVFKHDDMSFLELRMLQISSDMSFVVLALIAFQGVMAGIINSEREYSVLVAISVHLWPSVCFRVVIWKLDILDEAGGIARV